MLKAIKKGLKVFSLALEPACFPACFMIFIYISCTFFGCIFSKPKKTHLHVSVPCSPGIFVGFHPGEVHDPMSPAEVGIRNKNSKINVGVSKNSGRMDGENNENPY